MLSVVGKVFCKILNNRLVERLDKGRLLHEGQAGFRLKRSCIDNVYTLSELVQGRLREGKTTYAFFLDVQKAYDMVWRDGLWLKLWDMGVKGRIWRVIKKMYESSRSAVLLDEIEKGDSSLKAFPAMVEESIGEREREKFVEGLNSKVKLTLYRCFGREVQFKKYLHGLSDAGTRLLFKFRSGTHGLNEELGRHRGREGKKECVLCGDECESVSHTLWDCSAYTSIRAHFLLKLKASLGGSYARFEAMSSLDKSSFVLGNELWEEHFESLLALVKAYIIDIWEERKSKLYGNVECAQQPRPHSPTGDLGEIAGQNSEGMCHGGKPGTGKFYVYVAPPTPVGAWSMALGLRQRFEYYYYSYYIIVTLTRMEFTSISMKCRGYYMQK